MIFLDIETTSLQADTGILVAVGLCEDNKDVEMFYVNTYEDEKKILQNTFEKINNKTVVTFNGKRFDIPFLITRGIKYNLIFPKIKIIDLYFWAWKYLRMQSKKFHDICVYCDIDHQEISGREVNELYIKGLSGDIDSKNRIASHLHDDVFAMRLLYNKIEKMVVDYPPPDDIYR